MISMYCVSLKHIKFRFSWCWWCFQWQFSLLLCDFATVLGPHLVCVLKQNLLRTVDIYTLFLSGRSSYSLNISKCIYLFIVLGYVEIEQHLFFSTPTCTRARRHDSRYFLFIVSYLRFISGWKQGPELNRNIATRCRIICDFMLLGSGFTKTVTRISRILGVEEQKKVYFPAWKLAASAFEQFFHASYVRNAIMCYIAKPRTIVSPLTSNVPKCSFPLLVDLAGQE